MNDENRIDSRNATKSHHAPLGSSGTMNIMDGGAVTVTNGSSYFSLEKNSAATVTVDGKGSTKA